MKKRVKILSIAIIIAFTMFIGMGAYLGDYYRADVTALSIVRDSAYVSLHDDLICFVPESPKAGLIFYPGGKVQYEAYAPLLEKLAENGVLCVLVHMPGNLAVLDMNAADGIREKYPDIQSWYIGGHSLGGAMAASYASKHSTDLNGLILLAAYSTTDLSDSGLSVLSVYGSEDGVLNREKYDDYFTNLPDTAEEVVIDGGCHSYFGNYGLQDGDGSPTITREEQMSETVAAIFKIMQLD